MLGGPDEDFLAAARATIEENGYAAGTQLLKKVFDATQGPTEEIKTQIQREVQTAKEAGTLQLTDEQVAAFVDMLRRALEATFQAKIRAGIERYWPVSRLAIRAEDPLVFDAVSAFRKIIVSQSGAKELDIVAPGDTWRGMKIDIDVHMDSVSAAYKLWAKKIEILLRSQDAWKIKAGLERGEYSVGIEGQKVRIDPSMVSFVESVPDHVVEEPFEGGVIYLDRRLNKDLLAEGYAREIVSIVKDSRKEMKMGDESVVELDIVGNAELRNMLKPWRDMILREANALEVRFASKAPEDAYVIEAILGKDTLYLGIRQAQM
jgi:isoleucyl-tRNA synthetase